MVRTARKRPQEHPARASAKELKVMKRYHLILLLVATLLPSAASAKAFNTDRTLWRKGQEASYRRLPTQRLLRMGEDFLYRRELSDSAFLCYTIVAERYRPEMADSDIALCLEGYYGRWMCRFMNYSEIPLAMQDLSAAQEIIERTSLPRYKFDLYYGQSYLCMLAASGYKANSIPIDSSLARFRHSAASSLGHHDYRTFNNAFINMVKTALYADSLQKLTPFVDALRQLKDPDANRRRVSLLWYEGTMALKNGDELRAIACYDSLLALLPHDFEHVRLKGQVLAQKASILFNAGQLAECGDVTQEIATISHRFKLPDLMLLVYLMRMDIANREGNPDLAHDFEFRYLVLKDSLEGEKQIADFQEITFGTQRRAMQRDLDASRYRNRLRGYVIGFSVVLVALLVLFILRQRRSNLRLRRRSEMLYRQLQSTIHSPAWIDSAPAVMCTGTDVEPKAETDHVPESDTAPPAEEPQKYARSGMNTEKEAELADRIREYVLGTDAIYSPDFAMPVMAAALDTNRQYLSQCINHHFGCNFSTLVNRARIRRAMLLLDDERHYGNYSIEGIAEAVGFRSRDSFNLWFRRFTDLSAAEYRRLSKHLRPRL